MLATLLALGAAIGFAIGNILQKNGLKACENLQGRAFWWTAVRQWDWLIGMGLIISATFSGWAANMWGDLSIVQPLISVNPVISIILAHYFLKESAGRWQVVALGLTILSIVLLSMERSTEASEIVNERSYVSLVVLGFLILLGVFYKFPHFSEGLGLSIRSGICFAGVAIALKFSQLEGSFNEIVIACFVVFHFVGFLLSQKALSRAPVKLVIPVSALLGMFIPVVIGWTLLGETVNLNRILALALAMVSFFYFAKEGKPLVSNR
ncbi:DMT family transporter [Fibrobacterales bacterium]|nr:DMT family transporter [Fibrobacterales bacterium]